MQVFSLSLTLWCIHPSAFAALQFLTAKPAIYLVNLSERDYARKKNKWLPKLFEWVQVRCVGSLGIQRN